MLHKTYGEFCSILFCEVVSISLISIWRLQKLILDHLICPFRTGLELSSQRR